MARESLGTWGVDIGSRGFNLHAASGGRPRRATQAAATSPLSPCYAVFPYSVASAYPPDRLCCCCSTLPVFYSFLAYSSRLHATTRVVMLLRLPLTRFSNPGFREAEQKKKRCYRTIHTTWLVLPLSIKPILLPHLHFYPTPLVR